MPEFDVPELDFSGQCRAMFERHRVAAFGGSFHVPDVDRYPALFAWDSGYHALSTVHLSPELAVGELTTLYRANTLGDGQLSHQRFVPGAEEQQARIVDLFGPMFDADRTAFIDPPTAAFAVGRVGGPPDLLDAAVRHLDALGAHRCLPGSVLPVALHPFETGTEGSPITADLFPSDLRHALAYLKSTTVSAVAAGMDPVTALEAGHAFVVLDPTICGWYLLALEELGAALAAQGRDADAERLGVRADAVAAELCDRLWWDEGELFGGFDLVADRPLRAVSAMGLIPAIARRIDAEPVVARHLRPGAEMWGPRGFAAGCHDPTAGVGGVVQWSGNAVWGATVYWAHLLALRVDRVDLAARLRQDLVALVGAHGFREFYDAWTGAPGGAGASTGFTWPALVLDMRAGEARATN